MSFRQEVKNTVADFPVGFEPFLDPEEAAKALGVTPGTLAVWRSTERYLLPYLKIGGKVKYRPKDIHLFIESKLITPKVSVNSGVA